MSVYDNAIKKKDFLQCVKEIRSDSKVEEHEYQRASKKKIIRTRLVQLYSMGVYSNKQIADMLGISYVTVGRMLKEEEVVKALNEYQEEEKQVIDAKLRSLRERATDTLSELLDSDEDNVRLQTAKVILDKTGHGDKKEVEQNINISYEERLNNVLEGVSFDVQDLEYLPASEVNNNGDNEGNN